MSNNRNLYIDNLRIFLTILVILHHLVITYCGMGGWYYVEHQAEGFEMIPFVMFLFSNQSFFMGMFFLIASYFSVPSIERKGAGVFLKDRMIRLGIPLVVFYFIIQSLTVYILAKYLNGSELSYFEYVSQGRGFGFGPMWFVETLVIFSLIFALVFYLKGSRKVQKVDRAFPAVWKILLFALFIGVISFLIRVWIPMGSSIPHTGLQQPFFTQYIAMMILGVYVYKYNWFEKISFRYGVKWFITAQVIIFIGMPAFLYLGGGAEGNTEPFQGGFTWQSFTYSVVEQINGIALMIALVGIFKLKFNTQGNRRKLLSGAAYTAYIIHPLILVAITVGLRNWEIGPYLKLMVLIPVVAFVCFGVAVLIRKIPGFSRIL